MTNGDFTVISGKSAAHCGGCITLHDHADWSDFVQRLADCCQQTAGKLVEALIRSHNIQVIIGHDTGYIQNLIEHLAVLGSDTAYAVQAASFRQCVYYRKQLNSFWSGPENCYHFGLC